MLKLFKYKKNILFSLKNNVLNLCIQVNLKKKNNNFMIRLRYIKIQS